MRPSTLTLLALSAALALALPAAADEASDTEEHAAPPKAREETRQEPAPPAPAAQPAVPAPAMAAAPAAPEIPPEATPCGHPLTRPSWDLGDKTYKQRINTVARKPLKWDLDYIWSRDRGDWHGFSPWHGIRDCRPLVARKALGFHDPHPHRRRAERVLMIARGPLHGPETNQ